MLFTGSYEISIDSKNRLAIPSEIRNRLDPQRDGEAIYAMVGPDRYLCLYTESEFEKLAENLGDPSMPPEKLRNYKRMLFSLSHRLELDSQGRIRLPKVLIDVTKLERKIILAGVGDHIELLNHTDWDTQLAEMTNERADLMIMPSEAMNIG